MKEPNSTKKVYKLFRQDKKGNLFPLFISKKNKVLLHMWLEAEFIPTKGYAHRAGWHSGFLPIAEHLKKKDGTFEHNRVWAECEIPADVNWQEYADNSPTKDLRGDVPKGGYYCFKRPKNQGGTWVISGAIKVNKVLNWEEVENLITERKEVKIDY